MARAEEGKGGSKRSAAGEGQVTKRPFETLKALALAVLLALCIRSFIVEPFKIPSGSMIPTLLVGDYIIVNKFSYGVREPFSGRQLIPLGTPDRGDVVVFRFPDDERIDYIKRVVGLPGDEVEMREGRLWINGQVVDRIADGEFIYRDYQQDRDVEKRLYRELAGEEIEYSVIRNMRPSGITQSRKWVVPDRHYFMMGDNRDNSRDSRLWKNPFVSPEQIKGRAIFVHWSWVIGGTTRPDTGFILDFLNTLWRVVTLDIETIRWDRIGRRVGGVAD